MIKAFLMRLKEQGMTQEQIAEKAGLRQSQISILMKGGDVKASTLIKIAKAFNVSTDTVLGLDQEPEDPIPAVHPNRHTSSNNYGHL